MGVWQIITIDLTGCRTSENIFKEESCKYTLTVFYLSGILLVPQKDKKSTIKCLQCIILIEKICTHLVGRCLKNSTEICLAHQTGRVKLEIKKHILSCSENSTWRSYMNS